MKAYYDDFADIYDKDMGESDSMEGDIKLYAKYAQSPILDMGCGTGRLTIPLVNSGYRVTAVDISENMIQKLKSKLPVGAICSCYRCSGTQYSPVKGTEPFKLIVLAFDVFLHFILKQEQEEFLKKAKDWLADDATMIIDCLRQNYENLVKYKDILIEDYKDKIIDGYKVDRYKKIVTDFDTQINYLTYIYILKNKQTDN
ncbi:class I SAM-dependent methyltransferase, partial [Candidatus Babeliales bacterium]|nr:class I SAM-dependent methyltransferase [Candidatus Babeliales bacterium]